MEDIVAVGVTSVGEIFGLDLGQTSVLIVAIGLACLGSAFHSKRSAVRQLAPLGWVFIGLYFYLGSAHYVEINDPVPVSYTHLTLPTNREV